MKRKQITAALLAAVLFGCGAIAGALGYRYYGGLTVSAKTSETYRERYLSEMRSEVKLSDQQMVRLEAILDETKAKYRALREQNRPAMVRIKEDQVKRVKEILTSEQAPLYEQLVAERQKRSQSDEFRERREEETRSAHRKAEYGQ